MDAVARAALFASASAQSSAVRGRADRVLAVTVGIRDQGCGRTRSSWLRELMSSFTKTLRRWYCTVRALMNMPTTDLGVRQPVAGELRDQGSPGRSAPAYPGLSATRGLPGGEELVTGPLCERLHPHGAQHLVGGAQVVTGIGTTAFASAATRRTTGGCAPAQPRPGSARATRWLHGRRTRRRSPSVDECARPRLHTEGPAGPAGRRHLGDPLDRLVVPRPACPLRVAASISSAAAQLAIPGYRSSGYSWWYSASRAAAAASRYFPWPLRSTARVHSATAMLIPSPLATASRWVFSIKSSAACGCSAHGGQKHPAVRRQLAAGGLSHRFLLLDERGRGVELASEQHHHGARAECERQLAQGSPRRARGSHSASTATPTVRRPTGATRRGSSATASAPPGPPK